MAYTTIIPLMVSFSSEYLGTLAAQNAVEQETIEKQPITEMPHMKKEMSITEFRGKFRILSNFWPCRIEFEGLLFPSVEHAFQAAKTLDINSRLAIQRALTPGKAKIMSRLLSIREDWLEMRVEIMRSLLVQKFSNPELKAMLLSTKAEKLIEGNTWGDTFWGCIWQNGEWVGQNQLGKLLMEIRDQLT